MAITTPAVGANSYVTLARESTYGTQGANPATGWKIGVLQGAGVSATQALIYSELLASDPNYRDPVLGKKDAAGSLSSYLGNDTACMLLRMGLGDSASSFSSPNATHTFKIKSGSMPSYTMEVPFALTAATQYFKALGVMAKSMKISGGVDGFCKIDLGLLAASNAMSGTAAYASPADKTTDVYFNGVAHLASADVKVGGSAFDAMTAFEINVEHNHYADDFRVGQAGVRSTIPRGMARVTGSITAMFQDTALYTILTGGSSSSLDITYSSGANNSIQLKLPKIFFTKKDPVINSDGPITLTADFTAVYNAADLTSFVAVVKNQIDNTSGTAF